MFLSLKRQDAQALLAHVALPAIAHEDIQITLLCLLKSQLHPIFVYFHGQCSVGVLADLPFFLNEVIRFLMPTYILSSI